MHIHSSVLLLSALSLLGVTTTSIVAAPTSPPAPTPIRFPLRRIATNKSNDHIYNKRDNLLNALDDNSLGSKDAAALLNDIDLYQYGIQVNVGQPPQKFLLLFDTGSSDTWVPSTKCTKAKGCLSGRQYDPDQSTTYQGEKQAVNITYGIGSATGHYFVDRLQVGDQLSLAVSSQTLVKMDNNKGPIAQQRPHSKNGNDDDDNDLIDGIFGAGFPEGTLMAQKNGKSYQPFAMNLWKENLIPAPLFSLTMAPDSMMASNSEWIGQVTFGAIDDDKRKDVIQYTPVLKRNDGAYSHWMASVKGFQYNNGTNTNFHFTDPTHFLVDTGSNFMYLPEDLSHQLADLVSHGKAKWDGSSYTVDCDLMKPRQDDDDHDNGKKKVDEPVLNVMFPQQKDDSDGKDGGSSSFPMSVPVSRLIGKNGPDQCVLLFVPSKTKNVFTLGNFWLRNFVSVFDFGDHRLGFSPLFSNVKSSSW